MASQRFPARSCLVRAFTMVELLVAMTIVGILLALAIPAVQQSRVRVRNTECQNRLRQIGVALANHEALHGFYHTDENGLVALLPFLEHSAEYELATDANFRLSGGALPLLNIYRCPSETMESLPESGQISNYLFNCGTQFTNKDFEVYNGFRKTLNVFTRHTEVDRPATYTRDITDGLSQTAALSERLTRQRGVRSIDRFEPERLRRETRRFLWTTAVPFPAPGQEEAAVQQCRFHRIDATAQGVASPSVLNAKSGYNHLLTPNHPACINGPNHFDFRVAILPPSSLHPGGVNVLFADGGVRFTANAIDREVWTAAGTRNGQETVSF